MTMPGTHEPKTMRVPLPDGTTATMVRTWTRKQVEEIIGEALDITEALDPASDLRDRAFATALNLVGQMAPRESGLRVAPMSAIDNGRKL